MTLPFPGRLVLWQSSSHGQGENHRHGLQMPTVQPRMDTEEQNSGAPRMPVLQVGLLECSSAKFARSKEDGEVTDYAK
jgi:hypothetical protein